MNRLALAIIAAAVMGGASATLAVSPYFDELRFIDPAAHDPSWTSGSSYTTHTLWDDLPAGYSSWTAVNPGLSAGGNRFTVGEPDSSVAPSAGSLTISGAINATPYIFGPATHSATIRNYGGADGSPVDGHTGTRVLIQIAQTQGASGSPYMPTGLADAVVDLRLTDSNGVILAGGDTSDAVLTLLDSRPNAADFAFNVAGESYKPDAQQWLYEFNLTQWTGDFNVVWQTNSHSVFEALQVDTQLAPEPASLGVIAMGIVAVLGRRKRRHGGQP